MRQHRKPTGASMIAMSLFAAFFILLPLGIFGFELLRFSIAQQQLRAICDASALSAAVGIASTKSGWTPTVAQTEGMKAGFITFRQNVIVGNSLGATGVSNPHYNDGTHPTDASAGQCEVSYQLMDQNFNPVATGDPAAKLVRCEAAYGYVPPIGQVLGFTKVPVVAFADGGLPQLDIVLAFDISGSMDDQTPVTYVRRYFDTTTSATKYAIASVNTSTIPTIPKSSIYNINYPPITGSSVNALPPQNLNQAEAPYPTYDPGNNYPYHFHPTLRCDPSFANELGAPPGNKTTPATGDGTGTTYPSFTDVVVNLDGKDTFTGFTDPVSGLSFPDLGTLVEASRGNLNDPATLASATPGVNWLGKGVSANSSYQSAYRTLADNLCQPMAAARSAAGDFYNTMNISANCHFGLITFSNGVGTDKNSKWQDLGATCTPNVVDKAYNQGGTAKQPLPLIRLVQDAATSNYDDCKAACTTLQATGKTDIADALAEGIYQLSTVNNLTRIKARRAIVLFTDGMPNIPGGEVGNENSPAANAAYDQATLAAKAGIKIYCIGLSQNTKIQPIMKNILKKISDTTSGQYIVVTSVTQLDAAFQSIAKALIVLREQ